MKKNAPEVKKYNRQISYGETQFLNMKLDFNLRFLIFAFVRNDSIYEI